MANERKLTVILAGDSKGLSRSFHSAENSAGRFGSKIGGLGRALVSFGKTAAIGLGAAAVGIGVGAAAAINAGSDLAEVLSKSNTVFKEQGAAMEEWADTSAEAFGQSKKEALEAASSFGNMFIQLGIGRKESALMSKSMTELASDFASFHNADISEVLIAQQAAFRGEYDAVQKFVPTINAAAVEQKALKMGLAKTTKELDAQDKALAVQALLMEGAGDAAGDFARTSDGLANKQRILSARFEDVKAKIGQGLMPVALGLATFFSERLLPVFEEVGGGIMAMVGGFNNAEEGITSSGLAGWLEGVGIWAHGAYLKLKEMVESGLEAINAWWDRNGENITKFVEDLSKTIGDFLTAVGTWIWETALPALDDFRDWFINNEVAIAAVLGAIAAGFLLWAINAGLAAAATIVAAAPILVVIGLAALLAAGLYYAYTNWGWFKTGVDNILPVLGKVVGFIASIVTWLYNMVSAIDRAIGRLGDLANKIRAVLPGMGMGIGSSGGAAEGVSKFIKSKPRAMGGPVSAGGSYIVGERGPEWFSPRRSGHIIPNGGGGITLVNHGVLSGEQDILRWLSEGLRQRDAGVTGRRG